MVNVLWFIIWLIILIIFSFWIAGFLAFFYIILYPITVCIPAISVSLDIIYESFMVAICSLFPFPTASHRLPLEVHSIPKILRRKHDGRQALVLSNPEASKAAHSTNKAEDKLL